MVSQRHGTGARGELSHVTSVGAGLVLQPLLKAAQQVTGSVRIRYLLTWSFHRAAQSPNALCVDDWDYLPGFDLGRKTGG